MESITILIIFATMKHLRTFILLTLITCIVVSCANGEQMRQRLAYMQACNQADTVFSANWLPTVDSLVNYFDSHGSSNEQMQAHYLLARTYADMGEAPQALDEFHRAAECADTTASDCDYSLLAKIHGQTANLFLEQLMPHEMLTELQKAHLYAKIANDTLAWICFLEWQHFAYGLLNQHQDAITVLDSAYNQYIRYGYEVNAANCASVLVAHLIITNNNASAKHYMDIFERYSLKYSNGEVTQGAEIYYFHKGSYYLNIGMPDSAEYYFRKEIATAQTTEHLESAYKGLYNLYNNLGEKDSIAKYANLCYIKSEQQFVETSTKELRHMHSLYNYSRNQKIAQEKTQEALRSHQKLIVTIITSLFVCILVCIYIYVQRHRKKQEIERIEADYNYQINMLEQAKYDLVQLKQEEFESLLQQKQNEIKEWQNEIEKTQRLLSPHITLVPQMTQTEIFHRLQYLIVHPSEKMKKGEWKSLDQMVNEYLPNFKPKVYSMYHLSEDDYHICLLIRLNFSLSEIGILAIKTPQELYKRRKFMIKKCSI